jgi:NAD-dependent dihydropyrimidine dehydrogenase PreA subunit/tetratricopeptide (TPR) repeat protein
VLIAVQGLMVLHVVQWWWSGVKDGVSETLSPIEPSEAMYTLETGRLNAGFVFFALALLATFVFGRFVCGWGCHVVALQDWCAHLMKKVGVHPKPFRSRFLVLGPAALGFYMFVWPTLKREVVVPGLGWLGVKAPAWTGLAEVAAFPGLSNGLIIEDYWRTFPAWYVAVPFLLVCGFGVVYVLGAKGFCSSACPYGGLFSFVDRFSPGRIVVSDACEGCGHCTAVCSSNVRVHQEVRDFGMVVDPGCMKCMDCVTTCPKGALSWSWGVPAVVARPRDELARERVKAGAGRPGYDLSWWEDAGLMVLGVMLFVGFRGMFNAVPLLMAGGMAGVGLGLGWKVWGLVREPSVRLQSLVLKHKGRWTWRGAVVGVLGGAYIATGLWGLGVRGCLWRAEMLDYGVTVPLGEVFSSGYVPAAEQAELAGRAIGWYRLAGPRSEGGWGWAYNGGDHVRLAWLHAVRGERGEAERHLRAASGSGVPTQEWMRGLVTLRRLAGDGPEAVLALHEELLAERADLHGVRLGGAQLAVSVGDRARAERWARELLRAKPAASAEQEASAIGVLLGLGLVQEAGAEADRLTARRPRAAVLRFAVAMTRAAADRLDEAEAALREAVRLEPGTAQWRLRLAEVVRARGRGEEAAELERQAEAFEPHGRGEPGR